MLKVKVNIVKDSFNEGVIPLRKEFIEENVMVFREEDTQFVLLMKSGSKKLYSKTHYSVKEL